MTEPEFDFEQAEADVTGDTPATFTLTEDMLRRRMVWAIAPCRIAAEVVEEIGLLPSSDDVEDQEHQELHVRQLAVQQLTYPTLNMLTAYATEATIATLQHVYGEELTDNPLMSQVALAPIIFQSTLSVLCEMASAGAIFFRPPFELIVVPAGDEEEESTDE